MLIFIFYDFHFVRIHVKIFQTNIFLTNFIYKKIIIFRAATTEFHVMPFLYREKVNNQSQLGRDTFSKL